MKKLKYTFLALLVVACMKDDVDFIDEPINTNLEIAALEGLKFQNSDITDGSLWNFKTQTAGLYTLEIRNHFNLLVSKSTFNAKTGDNVKEFYTRALQDGDYDVIILSGQDVIHKNKLTIK